MNSATRVSAVETLSNGDVVSFRAGVKHQYRVVGVARDGGAVHLDLASDGRELSACYYVGELAMVHS